MHLKIHLSYKKQFFEVSKQFTSTIYYFTGRLHSNEPEKEIETRFSGFWKKLNHRKAKVFEYAINGNVLKTYTRKNFQTQKESSPTQHFAFGQKFIIF